MDLYTNYPYSLIKHGIINSYPSLDQDVQTEVAIIGAGITGALAAWELSKRGIECVVVDKRHTGMGSTAASTSLIQYEIDTPLHKLAEMIGYKEAVVSYQLSFKAIKDLGEVCKAVGMESLYEEKCSLQFASYKKDVESIEKEYKLRKENGFDLEPLDERGIKEKFGFEAFGGLLNKDAAQLDAYVLAHSIFKRIIADGCSVYDRTPIERINHQADKIILTTNTGYRITARRLIIACGYESQQYLPKKLEELKCTFTIISEVFKPQEFWYNNCLIWETADPYLYIRTTSDNRILVGGKDVNYVPAEKQKTLLKLKAAALQKSFQQLFPHIPFKIDFKWSGAFGTTKDGLPYIGSVPELPNTYFALGYGGNGITFSLIAAQFIAAAIKGEKQPYFDLFSLNR